MKMKFIFYLSIIILLGSCHPGGIEYYEDTDVVYTNYEDNFDFQSRGTYVIPGKIVKLTGELLEGEEPEFVEDKYSIPMLNQMKANMSDLGWKIKEDYDPVVDKDVLVLFPAVWTNTTFYYYYNYWCWYYPYYCGWGWGYPSVSSYTTGTLLMTLVADGEDFITPTRVWTGAINGLLSGAYNTSRVTRSIDQAFTQSSYLKTN